MNVDDPRDDGAAGIAAAMADPARARILYCLMDGQARTCTELAAVAEVGASTTSSHLARLTAARLVEVRVQGKHRYHQLASGEVAQVLEGLSILAGAIRRPIPPRVPVRMKAARTCYDHLAGEIGVALHDRFTALGFLREEPGASEAGYELTTAGAEALLTLGVDVVAARALRRRFAYGCLDWSERRVHLGGALGAAVLKMAMARRWVTQDLDSRALEVTDRGRAEMAAKFGVSDLTRGR